MLNYHNIVYMSVIPILVTRRPETGNYDQAETGTCTCFNSLADGSESVSSISIMHYTFQIRTEISEPDRFARAQHSCRRSWYCNYLIFILIFIGAILRAVKLIETGRRADQNDRKPLDRAGLNPWEISAKILSPMKTAGIGQ